MQIHANMHVHTQGARKHAYTHAHKYKHTLPHKGKSAKFLIIPTRERPNQKLKINTCDIQDHCIPPIFLSHTHTHKKVNK